MSRRIKPIEEGSLRSLGSFFAPVLKIKPDNVDLKDWVERVLFHIHERIIKTYIVVESFYMPGLYYWLPTKPIQGYGRRGIKIGTELVVRTDSTRPDVVDVETITKVRENPRVFRLSPAEFRQIKRHLKEMKHG